MPFEEIIGEIRKQEKIINEAQNVKEQLYKKLLDAEESSYDSITVKQASKILNCSVGLIYKKINCGELKAQKIGSAIRVSKMEVQAIGG